MQSGQLYTEENRENKQQVSEPAGVNTNAKDR